MIGPSLQLTGLVFFFKKKQKNVDTQLVPSGGFGRLFLKSQIVKIAGFAGRMVSAPTPPHGHCTTKAVQQSINRWVCLIKVYLPKEVGDLWMVICQPLDAMVEETKVLFVLMFKRKILIL